MAFQHHTPQDGAAVRAEHPGCIVFEVITAHYALLMSAPREHADKPITTMPGMTLDMLDNATLDIRRPEAS